MFVRLRVLLLLALVCFSPLSIAEASTAEVTTKEASTSQNEKKPNALSNGEYLSSLETSRGFNQIEQHPISIKDKADIFSPVQRLFDGMREHNKDKIISAFATDASIIRASRTGVLKYTDPILFAQSITRRTQDMMDERIINYRIQKFENLASVWTYFVFYFNGKISHCGVNAIQVVQIESQWKIGSLMDTAATGSCEEFIIDHSVKDN